MHPHPHRLSLAIAAGIAALLLAPMPELPIPETWPFPADWSLAVPLDKLVHFLLFFLAARPWRRSLAALPALGAGRAADGATVGVAFGYGLLLELLQGTLTATRTADPFDALAGMAGALVAVLLPQPRPPVVD